MSRDFPDFIDPWKAADGKRQFQGTMPLKRMARLVPLLAAGEGVEKGVAGFIARFAHDAQGAVIIDLHVEASLPLVCQRSLAPYREQVRREACLAVITTLAEQDVLPANYEPVLVENGRLALQDLVEDELLLAVPPVPREPGTHAVDRSTDGEAKPEPREEGEPTHRPFEGLAGLLKDSGGG
jgi:uncharacterized protein